MMFEEDEKEPMNSWKTALVLVGMSLVAGIICAVLWYFTHLDEESPGSGTLAGVSVTAEPTSESIPEPTSEPMPEPTAEPTPEPTSEPTPEVTDASGNGNAQTEPDDGEIKEPVSGNESMQFDSTEEFVTPKDVINLRTAPSTLDAGNIAKQAKNGEVLKRTGINTDTGWSRIDYNGQTLYAVSQYLSTDLNYEIPEQASDPNRVATMDGRVIVFTDCDDWISPKIQVNLRTEPSTSEGNATISCLLNYGEKAHRTGYSADSGWSRVEYDGKILYAVTSYLIEVPEE